MIVSHAHKFIFIKTSKTAGTSIEIALSKFCGPADIITPISPEDETIRAEHGCPGPQNYLAPISDYQWRDVRALLTKGRRRLRFYNHAPALLIKERLAASTWSSYFKFCFERNPWDRVISAYHWKAASTGERVSLEDFIQSKRVRDLRQRGFDAYTIKGEVVVDRICRFEDLAQELEAVRTLLKLPEPLELPFAKASSRRDKRTYREVLSGQDRDRIAELFADEIALMGYAF